MHEKQDLKSLSRKELIQWFKENNFKEYRAKQVFNWIYSNNVLGFNEMSNLPQKLIYELEKISYITNLQCIKKIKSEDGTVKFLWELEDNNIVESVYIPYIRENRYSVCISTQVGCAMNCKFCATGLMGLTRNLTAAEIVDQVLKVQKEINNNISNVVFMGMGEPLDNIKNLFKAIKILNDDRGINIGARKMTVSTSGVIPGIRKLSRWEKQISLAVSLNAPNNKLRDKLMPINRKYPLAELINVVKEYIDITNRRVTFEYVLIDGVNDSSHYAEQLGSLLSGLLCHINLIPVNPVPELNVHRPPQNKVKEFKNILLDEGVNVTIRQERGTKIKAACGQLRYEKEKGGE